MQELISKTALLLLHRCDKAFYLYKHFPHLRARPDARKQYLLDRGTRLGLLARRLFPNGTNASFPALSFSKSVQKTKELLQSGKQVIYEASFEWNGAGAMVDILVRKNDSFEIYEVKSAAKVYPHHLMDVGFQYFILSRYIPLGGAYLVIPRREYVFHNELNISEFFKKIPCLNNAKKNFSFFTKTMDYGQKILSMPKAPEVPIGPHCFKPGACEFMHVCFPPQAWNEPQSILLSDHLSPEEKLSYIRQGIYSASEISDVGASEPIHHKQLKKQKKFFTDEITRLLSSDAAVFDMEFYNGPVPFLNGHRPFDSVLVACDVYFPEKDRHITYFLEKPDMQWLERMIRDIITTLKKASILCLFDKGMERTYAHFSGKFFQSLSPELISLIENSIDLQHLIRTHQTLLPPQWQKHFGLKKLIAAMGLKNPKENKVEEGLDVIRAYDSYLHDPSDLLRLWNKEEIIWYVQQDTTYIKLLLENLRNLPN